MWQTIEKEIADDDSQEFDANQPECSQQQEQMQIDYTYNPWEDKKIASYSYLVKESTQLMLLVLQEGLTFFWKLAHLQKDTRWWWKEEIPMVTVQS